MNSAGKATLRHWIYVPHDGALLSEAYSWQNRKRADGKWYQVIEPSSGESRSEILRQVGNEDVLYILADSLASLGTASELAEHLSENGLHRGHRVVKIFVSRSGDSGGTAGTGESSFAERLYEAMRGEYPEVVVYGYLGGVSASGFSSHKTAGLKPAEGLEGISEAEWNRRNLRAKENRVRFPPGPAGE
jgi:hypothetical protein